jgi:hypothetical protein
LTFALLQRNEQLAKELARAEIEFNLSMQDRGALKRKNAQLSRKLRTIFDVSRSEFGEPSDDEAPGQGAEQSAEDPNEEGDSVKEDQDGTKRAKRPGTGSSLPKVKRPKTGERKRVFGYLHPNPLLLRNLLDFCAGRPEAVLTSLAAEINILDKSKTVPRSIKRFPKTYQTIWNKFQRSRALYQEFLEDKYPEKILQAKSSKPSGKALAIFASDYGEEEEGEDEGEEEEEVVGQEPKKTSEEIKRSEQDEDEGEDEGEDEAQGDAEDEAQPEDKEQAQSSSSESSSSDSD